MDIEMFFAYSHIAFAYDLSSEPSAGKRAAVTV